MMKKLLHFAYNIRKLIWHITRPLTVGVRLILVREQSVLLVRHTYQKDWFLPGGGIKKGETVENGARREAREEVGANLKALSLFGVYTNFYQRKNDHIIVFTCDDFTLMGKTDWEIERFGFFSLNDLPEDVSTGCLHRIREYAAGQKFAQAGEW
ncbi:MAG: NUDIX domain-containing protein [Chloroflexota bacterium]|nr:NUDIX domain-containing protein [Chloroflexota bacterium]